MATTVLFGLAAIAMISCDGIYITDPRATVALSPPFVSLLTGDSAQLKAIFTDSTGKQGAGYFLSWTSQNTNVATVSSFGWVRGAAPGSTTITVARGSHSASAAVSVTAAPIDRR